MARHSKIQLQVLSLYRQLMRTTKDQPSFQEFVRAEFRKHGALPRTDFVKVEYLLRRGWRQLDMLKSSDVSGAGVFEKEESSKK